MSQKRSRVLVGGFAAAAVMLGGCEVSNQPKEQEVGSAERAAKRLERLGCDGDAFLSQGVIPDCGDGFPVLDVTSE